MMVCLSQTLRLFQDAEWYIFSMHCKDSLRLTITSSSSARDNKAGFLCTALCRPQMCVALHSSVLFKYTISWRSYVLQSTDCISCGTYWAMLFTLLHCAAYSSLLPMFFSCHMRNDSCSCFAPAAVLNVVSF